MTLVATWYPTEEQACEFNELTEKVYGGDLWTGIRVYKVDLMRKRGRHFVTVYYGDFLCHLQERCIVSELIKAGYFVL